ncbi:MAG TPA: hypothetical protein VI078_13835 [bacterium]
MNTRLKRDARLLVLFAVLAALPLAIWACSDAGDSPGGPTGPSSKYNPNIDYAGATITTRAEPSSITAPGVVSILAYFKDANGLPVEGVPLSIAAEGGASAYFSAQTNPTLTGPNGGASINLNVLETCPTGSYAFTIYTGRAWSAEGHVGFMVTGGSGGGTGAVTSVVITSGNQAPLLNATEKYVATVTETCSSGYVLEFNFDDGLGWTIAAADNSVDMQWVASGTFNVIARAKCEGDPDTSFVESDPYPVVVP